MCVLLHHGQPRFLLTIATQDSVPASDGANLSIPKNERLNWPEQIRVNHVLLEVIKRQPKLTTTPGFEHVSRN